MFVIAVRKVLHHGNARTKPENALVMVHTMVISVKTETVHGRLGETGLLVRADTETRQGQEQLK